MKTAMTCPACRPAFLRACAFGVLTSIVFCTTGIAAQTSADLEAAARVAAPVVPQEMMYSGTLPGRVGDTVEAVFHIYAAAEGGQPLWSETQRISVGADGKYSLLLGAASERGLPQSLFAGGQARWLGISVERAPELPRVELASVAYAMKSADAATLAGHAAQEFVTQSQLAATARELAAEAVAAVIRDTGSTLTGSGTAGQVAMFTDTSTLGNSVVTQSGKNIGIDTVTPSTVLDVNGAATLRGNVSLLPLGTATASGGFDSPTLSMSASAFKAGGAAANQRFAWEVIPTNNNTATPSANLDLLFSSGTGGLGPTGLSILASGSIQTLANVRVSSAAATASSGRASSGLVLEANAFSSSTVKNVPQQFEFQAVPVGNNTATPSATLTLGFGSGSANPTATGLSIAPTGVISFAPGQTFPGTGAITQINAGSGMLGGGTVGTVMVSVNQYQVPFLDNANTFSAGQSIYSSSNPALYVGNTSSGTGVEGVATSGTAVQGSATGGYGVYGSSSGSYGVVGTSTNGNGVYGQITAAGQAGVIGRTLDAGKNWGVYSFGNIGATGTKSSVVSVDNNTRQVALYAVESPGVWFEDYGSGQLVSGVASIKIDPAYGQTVNTGVEYHVFLTPDADCEGLYVTARTATGFEVRELHKGASNVAFDYRIVARRKGYETTRLADVTSTIPRLPSVTAPVAPAGSAVGTATEK